MGNMFARTGKRRFVALVYESVDIAKYPQEGKNVVAAEDGQLGAQPFFFTFPK